MADVKMEPTDVMPCLTASTIPALPFPGLLPHLSVRLMPLVSLSLYSEGYDGGDCCACTCQSGDFTCGGEGFACIDPDSGCMDDDDVTVDMAEGCYAARRIGMPSLAVANGPCTTRTCSINRE